MLLEQGNSLVLPLKKLNAALGQECESMDALLVHVSGDRPHLTNGITKGVSLLTTFIEKFVKKRTSNTLNSGGYSVSKEGATVGQSVAGAGGPISHLLSNGQPGNLASPSRGVAAGGPFAGGGVGIGGRGSSGGLNVPETPGN
ncbi:unnamed protein product, partial [Protopolystoma xenopodis]